MDGGKLALKLIQTNNVGTILGLQVSPYIVQSQVSRSGLQFVRFYQNLELSTQSVLRSMFFAVAAFLPLQMGRRQRTLQRFTRQNLQVTSRNLYSVKWMQPSSMYSSLRDPTLTPTSPWMCMIINNLQEYDWLQRDWLSTHSSARSNYLYIYRLLPS